jgi:hypothetical protein
VLAGAAAPGALPVVAAVVAATPRTAGADTSACDLRVVPSANGSGIGTLSTDCRERG